MSVNNRIYGQISHIYDNTSTWTHVLLYSHHKEQLKGGLVAKLPTHALLAKHGGSKVKGGVSPDLHKRSAEGRGYP